MIIKHLCTYKFFNVSFKLSLNTAESNGVSLGKLTTKNRKDLHKNPQFHPALFIFLSYHYCLTERKLWVRVQPWIHSVQSLHVVHECGFSPGTLVSSHDPKNMCPVLIGVTELSADVNLSVFVPLGLPCDELVTFPRCTLPLLSQQGSALADDGQRQP